MSVKKKAWSSERADWEVIETHIIGLQIWISQKRFSWGLINSQDYFSCDGGSSKSSFVLRKREEREIVVCVMEKYKERSSFRHGWIKANNHVIGTGHPLCSALALLSWLHPQASCVHTVARWMPTHPGLSPSSLASLVIPARVLGLVLSGPDWVTSLCLKQSLCIVLVWLDRCAQPQNNREGQSQLTYTEQ